MFRVDTQIGGAKKNLSPSQKAIIIARKKALERAKTRRNSKTKRVSRPSPKKLTPKQKDALAKGRQRLKELRIRKKRYNKSSAKKCRSKCKTLSESTKTNRLKKNKCYIYCKRLNN
jgi:hypothetical protein